MAGSMQLHYRPPSRVSPGRGVLVGSFASSLFRAAPMQIFYAGLELVNSVWQLVTITINGTVHRQSKIWVNHKSKSVHPLHQYLEMLLGLLHCWVWILLNLLYVWNTNYTNQAGCTGNAEHLLVWDELLHHLYRLWGTSQLICRCMQKAFHMQQFHPYIPSMMSCFIVSESL